jgi:hypothetical protein
MNEIPAELNAPEFQDCVAVELRAKGDNERVPVMVSR